jgi:hypothetical protein
MSFVVLDDGETKATVQGPDFDGYHTNIVEVAFDGADVQVEIRSALGTESLKSFTTDASNKGLTLKAHLVKRR